MPSLTIKIKISSDGRYQEQQCQQEISPTNGEDNGKSMDNESNEDDDEHDIYFNSQDSYFFVSDLSKQDENILKKNIFYPILCYDC